MKLTGEFEVKLETLDESLKSTPEFQTSRYALRKTFHGDFRATSVGEMMAAGSGSTNAGGYVAIDIVTAELEGKKGSFLLMHFGTRTAKDQRLTIEIVPSSGTGDLATITGSLGIRIEGGQHFYEFDYSL
jgi:hypothetical protein